MRPMAAPATPPAISAPLWTSSFVSSRLLSSCAGSLSVTTSSVYHFTRRQASVRGTRRPAISRASASRSLPPLCLRSRSWHAVHGTARAVRAGASGRVYSWAVGAVAAIGLIGVPERLVGPLPCRLTRRCCCRISSKAVQPIPQSIPQHSQTRPAPAQRHKPYRRS